METYGLEQYGITDIKEVVYNPTYEQLFEAEMDPSRSCPRWRRR